MSIFSKLKSKIKKKLVVRALVNFMRTSQAEEACGLCGKPLKNGRWISLGGGRLAHKRCYDKRGGN